MSIAAGRRQSPWTLWATAAAIPTLTLVLGLALVWRFPPFVDEGTYASWTARIVDSASERFVPLSGGKEPLLEWLAASLTTLGVGPFTAVRLVSVGASLGTLVVVGVLGTMLGGKRVGLVAALLAATCPFLVVYGVLGLYEALATFFAVSALVLQLLLARTLRLDVALLLGAAFGLGLLTKQSTLIAFALWPVSLLCLDWRRAGRAGRLATLAALAALSASIAYAIFSILRLSDLRDDLERLREEQYPVHSVGDALASPGTWLEQNWPSYRDVLVGYVTPAVLVAAALGFALGLRRRWTLVVMLAAWALGPLLVATLLADAPYPRYVHGVAPPVLALAGAGCVWTAAAVASALRSRRRPLLATAAPPVITGLVLLQGLVFDVRLVADPAGVTYPGLDDEQFVTGWPAGTGVEEVERELEKHAGASGTMTVLLGPRPPGLDLRMGEDGSFRFIRYDAPDAATALLAVENGEPLPELPEPLAWRMLRRVERPRNGTPLVVYESGVRTGGRFVSSPEALRELVTPDSRYDAFLAARPAVKAWADSWYTANGN